MIKKKSLSKEDKKNWEEYIKNPFDIFDKEISNKTEVRLKRYIFDLHGFTLDQANSKVKELILFCVENKYKEILLITGKGTHSTNDNDVFVSKDLGKIKYSVPEFIKSNDELNKFIISVNDADKKEGGEGAILISLKNL